MKAKAQIWGLDLMVAMVIFILGILSFYIYSINYTSDSEDIIQLRTYDGNIISDSILSQGIPENWGSDNVVKLGILTGNKINETKLEEFYNLAISDYPRTLSMFNTKYNYYFNLSESIIINSASIDGIGKKPENQENLIKIKRFTIYQNKPVIAYIYIWD